MRIALASDLRNQIPLVPMFVRLKHEVGEVASGASHEVGARCAIESF